ncbi:MAG: CoA-transferase subunit beta [Actinomycetota bacterium]
MSEITRAEVCVAAVADAWRGDGEIAASPMGLVPLVGARLARATFAPDLLLSDGETLFIEGNWAVGSKADPEQVEGWVPFRRIFDLAWAGRRHVMMGASQIDRYGNTNISAIGSYDRPTRQLLGVRGAPGNTISHTTSYWIPRHSRRVFVPAVDTVSGIGNDRAAELPKASAARHELRRVVTNLAVLDFAGSGQMRLASVHPGATVEEVQQETGFDLVIEGEVPTTRLPDEHELDLIRTVLDPSGLRNKEVR